MTFTEMIVKTHPNDDIGDIIIDEKNFIYAGSCPFAVLRKATFMGCAPETITPEAL